MNFNLIKFRKSKLSKNWINVDNDYYADFISILISESGFDCS
jgi:hypothetical protein